MYAVNHIPLINLSQSTTGCCSLIEPEEWDGQIFEFDNKLFAKVQTHSFLHIPLNMSDVMSKAQEKIDAANARADDWIILSKEISPWKAEHYFAVTHDVPELEMKRLSGTFITKVFEGPFMDARSWYKELLDYVQSKGKKVQQTYFFYTVCPSCAEVYGKNYVVGFAQVT